jgi:hypothetical protein
LTLKVGGGQKIEVMTHEQIVRKQMKMARNRHRRHSFTYGEKLKGPMMMLHELRQFYDVSYRVFLVKAQLRTLAANALKLSPYIPRSERIAAESKWLFSLVDEDDSGLIDSDELKEMILKTGQRVKDEELERILSIIDEDDSGEVDDLEFRAWYGDDSDLWLSKRRKRWNDEFGDR